MKRFLSIFLLPAFVALAMAGCTAAEIVGPESSDKGHAQLFGRIENATKVALGTLDGARYKLQWQIGDCIGVRIEKENSAYPSIYKYKVTSIDGAGVATFSYAAAGPAPEGDVKEAFYPFGATREGQQYVPESFDPLACMMSAAVDSDGVSLFFSHSLAYLMLNIRGGADVELCEVTVAANDPSVLLSGMGRTVKLNVSEPVRLNPDGVNLVVAVEPALCRGGLSVIARAVDGRSMAKLGASDVNLAKGGIYAMKPLSFGEGAADLSPEGHTANCYLVGAEGTYFFDAGVIGNGAKGILPGKHFHAERASIEPHSAEVLWELGTDMQGALPGTLVDRVALVGKSLLVSTTGSKGNALVGVRDESGNLLWSWHLWIPEAMPEEIGADGRKALNMNIGAMRPLDASTLAGDFIKTAGLLYQWGRKDPFPARSLGASPFAVETGAAVDNVRGVVENPSRFIGRNSLWLEPGSACKWLWGQGATDESAVKTIYDPSPYGYMVAPHNYFSGVTKAAQMSSGNYWIAQYMMPAAGFLANTSGALSNCGTGGRYWSACHDANNGSHNRACLLRFGLDNSGNVEKSDPAKQSAKTYAFSVRCVPDALADVPAGPSHLRLEGEVKDTDGQPFAGVQVSDGFSMVRTDSQGHYEIPERHPDACHVYITLPADAAVTVNESGRPAFYQKIAQGVTQYDFTLARQAVETRFRILALGDPQVKKSNDGLRRFAQETAPDIRDYIAGKSSDMPTYAITLGDHVHNEWESLGDIFGLLSPGSLGVPCFATIGNHDHVFSAASPVGDLAGQRTFEEIAGPVNYSFDRGSVHCVVIDDIIHEGSSETSCTIGLAPWVEKWLRADLDATPRSKAVMLFAHAKLMQPDYPELYDLLSEFAEARIIAGHNHLVRNYVYDVGGKDIYLQVAGSVNGVNWTGTVCGDGAPMGYSVFEMDGAHVANNIYKPVMLDEGFQMRMYRSSDFPSFSHSIDGSSTTYEFYNREDPRSVCLNIWNKTPKWTFEVYENGRLSDHSLTRKYIYDCWAVYWFYKVKACSTHSYDQRADHIYYYRKNSYLSSIRVVARDEYGNVFEQTAFTGSGSGDYPDKY